MGRKGVSKRKLPKPKNSPVPVLVRAAEPQTPQVIGNGEAISMVKGGKKKSSDSKQSHKKQ